MFCAVIARNEVIAVAALVSVIAILFGIKNSVFMKIKGLYVSHDGRDAVEGILFIRVFFT
jgi:hypothetical protein